MSREYLDNTYICFQLDCDLNSIVDIEVIQKGLANISFKFTVNGIEYVYRYPGENAGNLVDSQSELFAQYKALELGINKSVIYIDPTRWKLSYYIQDMVTCDLIIIMQSLIKLCLTYIDPQDKAGWFCKDILWLGEALILIKIVTATKGNFFNEFTDLIEKVKHIDVYFKKDGYKEVKKSYVIRYLNVIKTIK